MVDLYEVVKSTQLTHWHWALDEYNNALNHSNVSIRLLNDLLKNKKSILSKHEIESINILSNQIINSHSKLKANKSLPYQQKLRWLSSNVNGELYFPVTCFSSFKISRPILPSENIQLKEIELSSDQQKLFSHWETIPEQQWDASSLDQSEALSTLFQDSLQDCSFVSAFISLTNKNICNFKPLSLISPHTKSSIYLITLHFNGESRSVEISSQLPYLKNSSQSLFIRSESSPDFLYPALIEKAYLKIQGNVYDSKGSNAGIDTFILSGWIPQYITEADGVNWWKGLKRKFEEGKIVLNLGTGDNCDKNLPFHSNHDYSVVKFDDDDDTLVLKNPWGGKMENVQIHDIFKHFKTIYLNWNHQGFSMNHLSFIWSHTTQFYQYPQFKIDNSKGEEQEVIILLEKHLGFQESDINVMIFDSENGEILFTKTILLNQKFAKANNTRFHFSKFVMKSKGFATVVITNTARELQNFTLKAFASSSLVELTKSKHLFPYTNKIEDIWDSSTSGGNWSLQSYLKNPQFEITPQSSTNIQLHLSTPDKTLINFQLFYKDANPLSSKTMKHSLISTKYNQQSNYAVVNLTEGQTYILIPSTYDSGVNSQFTVCFNSNSPLNIIKLSSRLGLYLNSLKLPWKSTSTRLKYTFKVPYRSKLNIHLWSQINETTIMTRSSYTPQIRASLFYLETGEPILINPDFNDDLFGIWMKDVVISKCHMNVVLLIERFEIGNGIIMGEIGSDYRLQNVL